MSCNQNGVFSKYLLVRDAFKIFTGTPRGKRCLGRSRRRWEGNVRMDLKEIS